MGLWNSLFGAASSGASGIESWSVLKLRTEMDKYREQAVKVRQTMWDDVPNVEKARAKQDKHNAYADSLAAELKRRGQPELEPLEEMMRRKGLWK